jgi:hypothetical protein
LVSETRRALPAWPGQIARYDYEYERNGTRNLFMFFEPLAGYRHVQVTARRTQQDFAQCMQWLGDEAYPEAEVIRVVLDNLTGHHTPDWLIWCFHHGILPIFTPLGGSWLNMAESIQHILKRRALWRTELERI